MRFQSTPKAIVYFFVVSSLLLTCLNVRSAWSQEFKAGAFSKSIDPRAFPVWVNGGISGQQADRVRDTLFARCLVLEAGGYKVAIAIVDNCILPHEITDKAKKIIQERIGISPDRVLIAATHTHSAVSVTEVHGCPVQEDYARDLPYWIAEGIQEANERLQPAQYGTTSVVAEKYVHCRDWLMKPGAAKSTPFSGRMSDDVSMNPGFNNPDKIAPIGAIDRLIPILSIQDLDGRSIALLASFSTHYAGATPLSSDYFGVVSQKLSNSLRPDEPNSFVGIMANATSGNANCIDFSKPREPFTHVDVGNYIADQILSVLPSISYSRTSTLRSSFDSFDVSVRMPNAVEVDEAKTWMNTHLAGRLPKTIDENYARETVLLSQLPATRRMNLQALQLDDFCIAANPCESYSETGLKIRQNSPFALTMNIGLANGHCGYIPPPEMFQLGGYTTWRCRSSCLNEQAEPLMVDRMSKLLISLKKQTQPNPTTSKKAAGSPASPVSPSESLSWFEVDDGFEVQLVASEPQVIDPVSMQIDALGRLWVVEMRDYPSGQETPECRVVILEDRDTDGTMETSHTFAEGLRFATGIQPWRDGAIVTVEGELLFLRDTDGDFKADKTETWITGFSKLNPQLRANHPTITSDGWLTIASGLRGGMVSTNLSDHSKQPVVDLAGSDVRLHLVHHQLESISGPSQFGVTFDQIGRRYGCSNRHPCFEIIADRADVNLSPLAGLGPSIIQSLPSEAESKVYPLIDAWTTSSLHAGQFTAACGACVTHSPIFGSSEVTTALVCEPTGGLVQRKSLIRVDGIARETISPNESQPNTRPREWFASRDPWFRPVDLYEGPNGSIYVVDMYRAVIEHPEWVPKELKDRPDQRMGDLHGRIYRIVRKGTAKNSRTATIVDLSQAFDCLSSSDAWLQLQASRKVLESIVEDGFSHESESKIRKQLEHALRGLDARACLTCAGLLSAADKLSQQDIVNMLASDKLAIRLIGLRFGRKLAGSFSSETISSIASRIASEDGEEARLAAWLLAWLPSDHRFSEQQVSTSAKQMSLRANDEQLWMAITAMHRNQIDTFIRCYLDASRSFNEQVHTRSQTDLLPQTESVEAEAIGRLTTWYVKKNKSQGSPIFGSAADIVQNEDSKFSLRTVSLALAVIAAVVKSEKDLWVPANPLMIRLKELAAAGSPKILRTHAIRILGRLPDNDVNHLLMQFLDDADNDVVKETILAIGKRNIPVFTDWLLNEFATAPTLVRPAMFQSIRNHPQRLERLVQALESNQLTLRLFDANQLQSLKTMEPPELRRRMDELLANSVNQNREKLVLEYSEKLRGREVGKDPSIGKSLFKKNCASCHQVDGIGIAVGPNISDPREQTYEKLLIAILDPNRSIDANYFRYLALTDEGETVDGLLRESNANSVTLESQNGTKRTLNRSELSDFKSSGASMMPEGLESQISVDEMGELLWYIKNWRYVAENIPAVAKLP